MPLENIDALIGQNLRNWRGVAGLSMAELGAQAMPRLSSQQISKYELGVNSISCTRLVDFAHILGRGLLDFFEGIPKK